MEPTPRAVELAKPIMEALLLIEGTVERRRVFDPLTSTRTFNIAMTDIGQTMYLPKLMPYLATAAPRVDLAIHPLAPDATREGLQSGAIDLAIGPIGGLEAGFYQQRLYESSWVCAVRKGHPRVKDVLTIEMFLAESHLIVAPPGTAHGGSLSTAIYNTGEKRRVALRVPDFHVAAQILSATDLIAAVPMGFIEIESASDFLRNVKLPFATNQLVIRQFWHEKFHDDEDNQWLRRVVHQLFSDGG
ncbi:LysR family transcriptional regulator [Caballeronia choica]|jgi:DNA-binding transcriptional LysR family regulator|uniref:LysR family transcriptional regulator n=2 Tax=Caballeronia choica TaxID=326476 RepID=A0A158K602_9BURK|nr:LysR family transcriptional regulator [Caballeronia choica]